MEFLDLIEDKKKLVKIRDDLLERAVNSGSLVVKRRGMKYSKWQC